MFKRRTALLLLAPLLLTLGCLGSRFSVPDVQRLSNEEFGRPSDGLLQRADLQQVVDVQVLRRGGELIPFLNHADAAVRARAAFALGSVQDPNAVPELLGRLADVDANVRADAAFALGQTADSTATPTLLNALRSESIELVQAELVEAIGKTGDQDALLDLLEIDLPDGVEHVRLLAIARFGLRDIHHPNAVTHLLTQHRE
ncbi:MAG: HEAT repeat domain-containing protein, partial [Rubricoccaceae bacterium]|nr:HEAT repeat domain-containing protein [Rubricoccaceae bacterium]